MAEQNVHTQFGLADIERYLQGKMDAREMHEVEKAALQDPFLSDAIEGYRAQPFSTSYGHLDEIANSLFAEKEEARVVAMPVKKHTAWKTVFAAAAVILTVAGAWWLLGRGPAEKKINNIPIIAATQLAPKDSQAVAANAPVAEKEETKKQKQAVTSELALNEKVKSAPAQLPVSSYTQTDDKLVSADSASFSANIAQNNATDKAPIPITGDNKGRSIRGVVAASRNDLLKKPVMPDTLRPGAANSTLLNQNLAVSSVDNNAVVNNNYKSGPAFNANNIALNRQLNTNKADSTMLRGRESFAANPGDGFIGAKAKSSSAPLSITLNPLPNFDSVPITYLYNKNHSHKIITDSTLFPRGGWENFRDYVSRQLHKQIDTTGVPIVEGDVELEFTVDEVGGANDIKITRSLNTESDAKAMDLVKRWPGWIATKKHKKGKVVIQF